MMMEYFEFCPHTRFSFVFGINQNRSENYLIHETIESMKKILKMCCVIEAIWKRFHLCFNNNNNKKGKKKRKMWKIKKSTNRNAIHHRLWKNEHNKRLIYMTEYALWYARRFPRSPKTFESHHHLVAFVPRILPQYL